MSCSGSAVCSEYRLYIHQTSGSESVFGSQSQSQSSFQSETADSDTDCYSCSENGANSGADQPICFCAALQG